MLQNPLSILLLPFLSNLCYSFGICDLCSSCGNARFTPDWDQIGHRSNWLLTRCATVGIPWFLCHVKASWSEGIRPAQQCDPESQAGVDHPPGAGTMTCVLACTWCFLWPVLPYLQGWVLQPSSPRHCFLTETWGILKASNLQF